MNKTIKTFIMLIFLISNTIYCKDINSKNNSILNIIENNLNIIKYNLINTKDKLKDKFIDHLIIPIIEKFEDIKENGIDNYTKIKLLSMPLTYIILKNIKNIDLIKNRIELKGKKEALTYIVILFITFKLIDKIREYNIKRYINHLINILNNNEELKNRFKDEYDKVAIENIDKEDLIYFLEENEELLDTKEKDILKKVIKLV
jgi:hypothetical protein